LLQELQKGGLVALGECDTSGKPSTRILGRQLLVLVYVNSNAKMTSATAAAFLILTSVIVSVAVNLVNRQKST